MHDLQAYLQKLLFSRLFLSQIRYVLPLVLYALTTTTTKTFFLSSIYFRTYLCEGDFCDVFDR